MTRYIDADALITVVFKKAIDDAFLNGNTDMHKLLISVVAHQPTIDAELVRHGKWEMKPDPFGFFDEIPVCSECGCTTKMREKTKYCPHCGARMDENERDC